MKITGGLEFKYLIRMLRLGKRKETTKENCCYSSQIKKSLVI